MTTECSRCRALEADCFRLSQRLQDAERRIVAVQLAALEYLATVAETVARCAEALEQGNQGRARALEELSILQVLAHYLSRRLSEPCPPASDELERKEDTP